MAGSPPPLSETVLRENSQFINQHWAQFFHRIWRGIFGLSGSATWNPGSIANGAEEAKEVTITGATLGDFVLASFSLDVADLLLDGQVTATNTVTCVLANNTGAAVDLGSGTLYVRVLKR